MRRPPDWSDDQLSAGRLKAIELFRQSRIAEPLEAYLEFFDEYQGVVEELLETSVDLTQLDTALVGILTEQKLLEAFRYLAGPPISVDDLTVLAEATLSRRRITTDAEMTARVLAVVRDVLDRRRFPWIAEQREPTEPERSAAIIASAALIANSKVGTVRRNQGKEQQEDLVRQGLASRGLKELSRRRVLTLADAPPPGHFCPESLLGNTRADFVVRLWDQRVMGIECKVSNSQVNSFKRLNHEAVGKAVSWLSLFGTNGVVPVAVLSGVYNLANLREAQSRGLTLYWAHDLNELLDWIDEDKPPPATPSMNP